MTRVYFIRHCKPNYSNKNDKLRELTPEGIEDSFLVADYLADKNIEMIFSSPYKRCIDTIAPFAKRRKLDIIKVDDFRERSISNWSDQFWIEDFDQYAQNQWRDFSYKINHTLYRHY